MHDEDGKFGLNVRNKRGDQWIAYGDGSLFYEKSAENRRIAMETVEISVGQIVEAFRDPDQLIDTSKVTDLIPFIDESKRNNYPMFQMRDGNLVRRANLNDLADSNVTNFYGVPTTSSGHTIQLAHALPHEFQKFHKLFSTVNALVPYI